MKIHFFTLVIVALSISSLLTACNRGDSREKEHQKVEAPWKEPKDRASSVKEQVERNNQVVADQLDDQEDGDAEEADEDEDSGE